jgi:DNA-binding NtrC family response regulator
MGVEAKAHRNSTGGDDALASHGTASNGAPLLKHASPYTLSGTDVAGQMRKLEDIESEVIRMAIARYDGHMSEVARRLGIGRSTLYRKLKELGIESNEEETAVVVADVDAPRQTAG